MIIQVEQVRCCEEIKEAEKAKEGMEGGREEGAR